MMRNLFSSLILILITSLSWAQVPEVVSPIISNPIISNLQNRKIINERERNVTLSGNQAVYGDKVFENDCTFNGANTFTDGNMFSGSNTFTGNTVISSATVTNFTTGSKTWQLIASSVTSGAITDITVSGLNSSIDIEYLITGVLYTGGASAPIYSLRMSTTAAIIDETARYSCINSVVNDTPEAGLDRQSNQTGIEIGRNTATSNQICYFSGSIKIATVKMYVGKSMCFSSNAATTEFKAEGGGNWNSTSGSITALSIHASQTGGIGDGSYINIWGRR